MFNIICVLLLVSNGLAVLTPDKPYYDLTDAENHFAEFVQRYGKKYGNSEEYNKRFEIFKNKLTEINNLNEEHDATFGVTKFSDLTFEEFASSHLSGVPLQDTNATEKIAVQKEWVTNAPKSLDYRNQNLVTHVKDLETCFVSGIFSVIGNIEGQYAKRYKKLVSLSEQQVIDCSMEAKICHDEVALKVFRKIQKSDGCVSEINYPYTGEVNSCQTGSKIEVKVKGSLVLDTENEEDLVGVVAHYGPFVSGILFSQGAESYRGGIWTPTDCGAGVANAVTLIVGYGTDTATGKDFWILKNSWGSDWGEMGYARLERGKDLCCIGCFAGTAIIE